MNHRRRTAITWIALSLSIMAIAFLVGVRAANHPSVRNADTEKERWDTVKRESAILYSKIQEEFDSTGLSARYPGLAFFVNREGEPTLHYHTEVCPVHMLGMDGKPASTARSEEGPISDGLLLSLSVSPISEIEQVEFVSGITPPPMTALSSNASWVHQDHLEKLWFTYTCGVTIPARKIRFFVIASFNEQTLPPLIDAAYTAIQRALASEQMGDLYP